MQVQSLLVIFNLIEHKIPNHFMKTQKPETNNKKAS